MLRKQSAVVHGGLSLCSFFTSSSTSSTPRLPTTSLPSATSIIRDYVSIASDHPKKHISWPSNASFTPYDIFQLDRNAPYSKLRFYELAKIYHPDRPTNGHPLIRDLSPDVRLHRYRLIVAAHEILSDPVKRAEYDRSGTGWHGHPNFPRRQAMHTDWNDPIFRNATWEDWENWRSREKTPPQATVSNGTFASFIVLLTVVGVIAQASRLGQYRSEYEQRIQESTARSARFLESRRLQSSNQSNSSEARMQQFLIRRDPSGSGLKDEEEDTYHKALDQRRLAPLELHRRHGRKPC
jgi:curved DNA-binding protein CbpA